MTGRLYGVGTGPGDPELMTLKAVRLLSEVDVIAYPAPDQGESSARRIAAEFIPEGAKELIIRVPMRPGEFPVGVYNEAADEIAEHLSEGRHVAVLCEGDPFFYGSFIYLHDRLAGQFDTRIVPGVSSLMACAGSAGAPLIRRDGVLTVVPATLPDAALLEWFDRGDGIAILKVGRHLGRLRRLLEAKGMVDSTVYVAHATREEECVLPLSQLDSDRAPYFSMLLVGQREVA